MGWTLRGSGPSIYRGSQALPYPPGVITTEGGMLYGFTGPLPAINDKGMPPGPAIPREHYAVPRLRVGALNEMAAYLGYGIDVPGSSGSANSP